MLRSASEFSERARALCSQGKLDEAARAFRKAIELAPQLESLHFHLGNTLNVLGQLDAAIDCYRRAIELRADFFEAHSNLASAYLATKNLQQALLSCQRGLELCPESASVYTILGNVFLALGQPQNASDCYGLALAYEPGFIEALVGMGTLFLGAGRLDDAMAFYQQVLDQQPGHAVAHNNMGSALQLAGKYQEALSRFSRAIELKPEYTEAHVNRSSIWLLFGDFEQGWPEYEYRWKTGEITLREFKQPAWHGESIAGRTILLYAEQGLGDTIQFIRYVRLFKALGANVIVECQPALKKLLATYRGIDHLIGYGEASPAFDVHAPLLSLPALFKTTLETIPAESPYLFADKQRLELWRERLDSVGGFRIGINWRGRSGPGEHVSRDIPPDLFAPIGHMQGVRLVSLQKDATRDELLRIGAAESVFYPGEEIDAGNAAFLDTAAIISNLDLVITSDTAVAHLAGALGVRVWLALPYVPNWRWLLDHTDSPWYPTMQLFRQPERGNWTRVFEEITSRLQELRAT